MSEATGGDHVEAVGCGAIFGVTGRCAPGTSDRMASALAHRGTRPDVRPLPSGGFVGVLGRARRVCLESTDTCICVSCGTDYESPGGPVPFDPAGFFADAARPPAELDADFATARVRLSDSRVDLARDYLGCAPLYLARLEGGLAFASEYKALLGLRSDAVADREMLQHLQHAKRLPVGRTLVGGIEAVLPGSIVTHETDGSIRIESAPQVPVAVEARDVDATVRLTREVFVRAVERRTADLETIGIALSGGIDSIALAFACRAVHPGRRIVTVTAGASPDDPECRTAQKVAAAIGSDHLEIHVAAGCISSRALRRLVWHLEDPYSRSEALQLFHIGEAAARAGCEVLLVGQGADGLFAGMPRHRLLAAMARLGPFFRQAVSEFFTYTQLGVTPSRVAAKLAKWLVFGGAVPPVPRVSGTSYRPPPVALPEQGPDFLNRALAAGFPISVSQDVQKFERAFAAHGVAVRSPFYDRDLVRLAFTIDADLKIRHGEEKWVFRRACEAWVPESLVSVKKFPQRMTSDLAVARALDAQLELAMTRDGTRDDPLFEPGELARLRRPSPEQPYAYEAAMRIWTAVLTDLWAQEFPTA